MIGTSAVLQEEYSEFYLTPEAPSFLREKKEEVTVYTDLELIVTDSVTGRPISNAMISIDSINRTAVCDNQGKAFIREVLLEALVLDVIMWGYIASSTTLCLSPDTCNVFHVKMIRHC